MEQNIVVSLFEVESEAYQAMTQLKQYPGDEKSYISAAALVKKENGVLRTLDGFDTGSNTTDDMAFGGLVGALFGILGGPIGVLLGGSYGMLVGSAFDTDDAIMNASLLEQIAGKMEEGEVAIIGLAFEEDEAIFDQKLAGFKTTIARFDAAAVAAEVEGWRVRHARNFVTRRRLSVKRRELRRRRNCQLTGKDSRLNSRRTDK